MAEGTPAPRDIGRCLDDELVDEGERDGLAVGAEAVDGRGGEDRRLRMLATVRGQKLAHALGGDGGERGGASDDLQLSVEREAGDDETAPQMTSTSDRCLILSQSRRTRDMSDAVGPRPRSQHAWQLRADQARERAEQARARIAELRRRGASTPREVNEAVERAAQARLHMVQGCGRAGLAHERAAQLLDSLADDGGPTAAARRVAAARHRAAALDHHRVAALQEQLAGEGQVPGA